MSFFAQMQQATPAAPYLRPAMNLGGLLDIPTGTYFIGARGESILNGGLPNFSGNGARPNMGKTLLLLFSFIRAAMRYPEARIWFYDTELTASRARLNHVASQMGFINPGEDLADLGKLLYSDRQVLSGTSWFDQFRGYCQERAGSADKEYLETPFVDKQGRPVKILPPILCGVDSFSTLSTDSVLKVQEKATAGSSDRNMEAMRDASAKTQMLVEMPELCAKGGMYLFLTAHIGDQHSLDPYSPPAKQLAFLKQNSKFKNVPEKFRFMPSNVWQITGTQVMTNQTTKGPEYPRNPGDDLKGDTDLILASMVNLRGKGGPTGAPSEFIFSQADGILPSLSEFQYIKQYGRFGLGGNDRNYYLELCPDISLSRTTVRSKIEGSPKLQRALEITSELLQISQHWKDTPADFMCDPKVLHDDLVAKGLNWDLLLNTRGYWTFDQYTNPIPFLSTWDLLAIRAGTYWPFWLEPGTSTIIPPSDSKPKLKLVA